MEDEEFQNWDDLLMALQVPDDVSLLNNADENKGKTPLFIDSNHSSSSASPPDSVSSRIGEIESMLMRDDDDWETTDATYNDSFDNFLADILVDLPEKSNSDEVVDKESEKSIDSGSEKEKETETEKVDDSTDVNNNDDDADDPISKKRRRQLRNRDAALRSRERKKMYVRDLEMKSKYLEAECRRLGRLLQCFVAENQALRFSLQNGNAYGAPVTKVESAVLVLESLLLGSLLWFLGIVCLFTLPILPWSVLVEIPPENVEKKGPGSLAARDAGSKMLISWSVLTLLKSRRCKGSRTRMKRRTHFLGVLA